MPNDEGLGSVRPGTRTVNLNRRNRLFWPTSSTVTEVIPERTLALRVSPSLARIRAAAERVSRRPR